jgi:hypothetical protein
MRHGAMRRTPARWQVRLIAAMAVAGALTSTAQFVTTPAAHAATACRVDYTVTNAWNNGFQAAVKLTNLGDPLTAWKLTFVFGDTRQKITSGWQASWAQSGVQATATNLDWNRSIGTGGSLELGLVGTFDGANPTPTGFAVNDVTCTGAAPTSTTPAPATTEPVTTAPATSAPATTAPATTAPAGNCPASGRITYTLSRVSSPTSDQQDAYNRITTAMDQALSVYNCYLNISKALSVSYVPSVATADANFSGVMRFGAKSTMQQITAMHEIGHTMGVGTYGAWSSRLSGGVWTGSEANAVLRSITGNQSESIHGDGQHFWPYGLNYTSEVKSSADLVNHARIVAALRRDMGLPS